MINCLRTHCYILCFTESVSHASFFSWPFSENIDEKYHKYNLIKQLELMSLHSLVTTFPRYLKWVVTLLCICLSFKLCWFYSYCLWNSILNKGQTHQNPIPEIKEGMSMWFTTSSISLGSDVIFSRIVTFVHISILGNVYGVKMENEINGKLKCDPFYFCAIGRESNTK